MPPFPIYFPTTGKAALAIEISQSDDVRGAIVALDLLDIERVVTIQGGAFISPLIDTVRIQHLIESCMYIFKNKHKVLVVDGGTDVGIYAITGSVRNRMGDSFPLLGIVPTGEARVNTQVTVSGQSYSLEPNHSHFLFVEGSRFGSESGAFIRIPAATGANSVVLLFGGGNLTQLEIISRTRMDPHSPIIVVEGSGRFADRLAEARRMLAPSDPELYTLSRLPNVYIYSMKDSVSSFIDLVANLAKVR